MIVTTKLTQQRSTTYHQTTNATHGPQWRRVCTFGVWFPSCGDTPGEDGTSSKMAPRSHNPGDWGDKFGNPSPNPRGAPAQEQFRQRFSSYGTITKVELRTLCGFGYITYDTAEARQSQLRCCSILSRTICRVSRLGCPSHLPLFTVVYFGLGCGDLLAPSYTVATVLHQWHLLHTMSMHMSC